MTRRKEQKSPSIKYGTEGMSKDEYIKVRNGRNIIDQLFNQGIPSSALVGSVIDVASSSTTQPELSQKYPDGNTEKAQYEVIRVLDILSESIKAGDKDIRKIRHINPYNHEHRAQLEVVLSTGLVIYVRVVPNVPALNATFGELRAKWGLQGKLSSKLAHEKLMVLIFNEEETAPHVLRTNFFKFAAYIAKKSDPRATHYPENE